MKKYSAYFWGIIVLFFLCFIGLLSYWYPSTSDEYERWKNPFYWELLTNTYLYGVPRISFIFGPPIYFVGKWLFILLNSLIQLANCLCIFYIVFLRLPNIKELKDIPYFLIILCMSVFFVCTPSEVLFWINGAFNYSWLILFFLLMLCVLRQIYNQKIIFKDTWFIRVCCFILGFFVGMSNEALVPMALGFAVCFGLLCNYKKIKTPRYLSFLIFGLAIGCLVYFSAPAHYYKMTIFGFSSSFAIPLSKKLFFHIYHIDTVLRISFYFPGIVLLGSLICVLDKGKTNFKDEHFICTLIFLLLGFALAILLVFTSSPVRAYYPASVMFILAFLFFTLYITKTYKFNFPKLFCYVVLGISLFLTPRFVYPQYYLHQQEQQRNLVLKQSPNAKIKPYIFLKGPTENLTTLLIDWANQIKVDEDLYIVETNEPINW